MALANFFDKAALAAAQVAQGVNYTDVGAVLQGQVIGLAFDDQAVTTHEGMATLELAINLLARLYPRLALVPLGQHAETRVEALLHVARAINPVVDIVDREHPRSAMLVLGTSHVSADDPTVYVGSDGWIVRVSPDSPVGSGSSHNPFGAGAAACFGAANIFRIVFRQYLSGASRDQPFEMSLLDYQPNAVQLRNPPLQSIDIGETYLVGAGAIGNGTLWALSRTPHVTGVLNIIDHEDIDISNLQRYILAFQQDIDTPKVMLAARVLQSTALVCRPHVGRWADFLRTCTDWNIERIAVAVDSDDDRRAIQAALPRWIVNAWTQVGDLGVSRHTFLEPHACLMCLYLPDHVQASADEIVAEAIGLPDAKQEVRVLLYTGVGVDQQFLTRVAAAMKVPLEPLLAFEGESLRAFYTKAICGGAILRLGSTVGTTRQAAAVPLAFQSALAGIMQAAELIAECGRLHTSPPPVTTKIDLLKPLPPYLSHPATKHPSGRCICQDADYVARYKEKYTHAQ